MKAQGIQQKQTDSLAPEDSTSINIQAAEMTSNTPEEEMKAVFS